MGRAIPQIFDALLRPWVLLLLFAMGSLACQDMPKNYERKESFSAADTHETSLGKSLNEILKTHSPQSGFTPLASGMDALYGRLAAIALAEKTLDLQYYIWHYDLTGKLLLNSLIVAADRGVRVRLLVDDLHQRQIEDKLASLALHPNIEVRHFNPFHNRKFALLEVFRFSEANKRMHNKALIADNQIAVVGGRNIGDEYFEASPELDFGDIDLLALGPVVPEVSKIFDTFWNSDLSVPVAVLHGSKPTPPLEDLRKELATHLQDVKHSDYARALEETTLAQDIRHNRFKGYWGKAQALSDSPEKIRESAKDHTPFLADQVATYVDYTKKDLFMISAYFIPGEEGVNRIVEARKKNISVKILTNSLASNDVSVVHAAYVKYRKKLLQAGAEIFELKGMYKGPRRPRKHIAGSSRSGLHGKAYFIDNEISFIGSMNIDPRSEFLNTEMGILIHSAELTRKVRAEVEHRLRVTAYRVTLDQTGKTEWINEESPQRETFSVEPETTWYKRLWVDFLRVFVPESLL